MTKPFKDLAAKMSPDSQERARLKAELLQKNEFIIKLTRLAQLNGAQRTGLVWQMIIDCFKERK